MRTALAAYYRAEARGFAPGRELEDWLAAERELDQLEAEGIVGADPNASRAGEDGAVQPATEDAGSDRENARPRAARPAAKKTRSARGAGSTLSARGSE